MTYDDDDDDATSLMFKNVEKAPRCFTNKGRRRRRTQNTHKLRDTMHPHPYNGDGDDDDDDDDNVPPTRNAAKIPRMNPHCSISTLDANICMMMIMMKDTNVNFAEDNNDSLIFRLDQQKEKELLAAYSKTGTAVSQ